VANTRRRSSCGSSSLTSGRGACAIASIRFITANAGGQPGARLVGRQRREPPADGVDHAVDRLERHRLARVAAAGVHLRAERAAHALDEALDQRRLADPRLALHQHHHRRVLTVEERARQEIELVRAADEHLGGRAGRVGLGEPEPAQHLGAPRPPARLAAQEVDAQRDQIRRQHRPQGRRGRRLLALLAIDDVGPDERRPPGERLIQHHAHRVPVGLRAHRRRGALLGRHVRDGAEELRVGPPPVRRIDHQPEVEDLHPPVARHQHVGRLDVAVDLVRAMERVQPLRELTERVAQPGLVGVHGRPAHRRRRRPAGGGDVLGRRLRAAVDAVAGVDRHRHPVGHRRRRGRRAGARDPRAGPRRRGALAGARPGADPRQERLAAHQLHGEEPGAAVLEQLAERDEVRVVEVLQRAELGLEPEQRVGGLDAQRLQRDRRLVLAVEGLVDHPHAPDPEAAHDREA
jgi:hypothetical protein